MAALISAILRSISSSSSASSSDSRSCEDWMVEANNSLTDAGVGAHVVLAGHVLGHLPLQRQCRHVIAASPCYLQRRIHQRRNGFIDWLGATARATERVLSRRPQPVGAQKQAVAAVRGCGARSHPNGLACRAHAGKEHVAIEQLVRQTNGGGGVALHLQIRVIARTCQQLPWRTQYRRESPQCSQVAAPF